MPGQLSFNRESIRLCELRRCGTVFNESGCELPHPARADALAAGGASWFRDTRFHRLSVQADSPRRERSLRRRGFGVSRSYSVVMAEVTVAHLLVGVRSVGHEWVHHDAVFDSHREKSPPQSESTPMTGAVFPPTSGRSVEQAGLAPCSAQAKLLYILQIRSICR
jgi:hypothetical protein